VTVIVTHCDWCVGIVVVSDYCGIDLGDEYCGVIEIERMILTN